MKPFLIDSHTHLQFSAYDDDRTEVLDRALGQNIWMICAGSNSINSEAAVRFAEKYNHGVYATIGIHPSHAGNETNKLGEDSGTEVFDEKKMTELAASSKAVAVGECGLEYFREYNVEAQKKLFMDQIIFAGKVKKPLVIHCREAYDDTYGMLFASKDIINERGGLMHFFSGVMDEARKFLDLGFCFSFGGAITFPKKSGSTNFEDLIRLIPLDRILLETDAPYVAPQPYRGKRNEPSYVVEVARKAAEIKGISLDEMAVATTGNALRLFAIEAEQG